MDGVPRRAGRYRLHPPWNEPDGVAGGGPAVSGFRKRTVRNGRLLRPDGPFVLRAGVPMPGAMLLPDAADLVLVDWRAQVDAGQDRFPVTRRRQRRHVGHPFQTFGPDGRVRVGAGRGNGV